MQLEDRVSSRPSELNTEIVRAGAGAGKTTQLTAKVLEYAQIYFSENQSLPKVVVTTFTKKATEELRERLIKNACEMDDPNLVQFVNSKSNLHISTIHGVFSLFLHRYGLWMGIDSGFRIMDSHSADIFNRKNLKDALVQDAAATSLLTHFSVDQLTRVLRQFAEQYGRSNEIKPYALADIQAAAIRSLELKKHAALHVADSILAEADDQKWIDFASNLKATTNSKLKDLSAIIQSEGGPLLAAWIDGVVNCKKPSFSKKKPAVSDETNEALVEFLADIKKIEIENFSSETFNEYVDLSQTFYKFAQSFVEKAQQVKADLGVLEMSELEVLTRQMILKYPQMANAFASDWDFWLIDEFQDTSLIQIEILNEFIKDRPAYYVGDPQQSIYLFRGARSQVFLDKEKQIGSGGGKLSSLLKNYRSDPRLLLFFNTFFSKLDKQFSRMEPREEISQFGHVKGEPIAQFLIPPKNHEEPYIGLIELISKGIQQGHRYEDYCVLARTNSELGEIAQYFESYDLPTQIHSADGFYERREVLDVLTLLKFLTNPHDNKNLIRLLRSPWFKIPDAILAEVLSSRPIFYWHAFRKSLKQNQVIEVLEEALQNIETSGYFQVLTDLVRSHGLLDFSLYHDPTGRRESNIWKVLMKVKDAEREPGFHALSIVNHAFSGLRSVEGDEEWDAVAALEPNRINLMTIHKSKGLKFKHVLIPNLHKRATLSSSRGHEMLFLCNEKTDRFTLAFKQGDEQKFKHSICGQDLLEDLSEKEKEEHLRLLYVALTRAECTVNLHWVEPAIKNSMAERISLDLSEGLHQEEHYSYLVKRDFEPVEKKRQIDSNDIAMRSQWAPAEIVANGAKKISVSELLNSVNSVEEGKALSAKFGDEKVELRIEKQINKIKAPVIGQKLHALLERYKYRGEDFELKHEPEKTGRENALLKRAFDYTLNLNVPPIQELIQIGEVEWGFQLKTKHYIVEGQIDLWGTVQNSDTGELETWIVDYKSGSSQYSQKAFDQLNLYALAVREMGIKNPIRLAVVFSVDQKVEVQDAQSESEVRAQYRL